MLPPREKYRKKPRRKFDVYIRNTIFDKIEKDFGIKIAEEDRKIHYKDKYKLPYRVRMFLANDMKKEMKQHLTKNP